MNSDPGSLLNAEPLVNNQDAVMAVEMEHLSKSFGNNCVLKDISFRIKKGENLVILGKSGSGKSVLIKCLAGLIDHEQGSLMILGKKISDLNRKEREETRKKIGFLFQSGALYDSMSVRENLEFPLKKALRLKSKAKISSLVQEALNNIGLSKSIDKMPSELSGGMRKRLSLARTLILQPEIILYDEPTTGLDPITSKEISHLILDVQKKYNTSSIIITHDMDCARMTANRVIVLKDGHFFAEGSFEELAKSKDEWIRSFFD
ncbi:MAG: ATP-binding cassette domain-containing protein [Bacteroidota bacterium]|nr:ATP-binding cassette domain-containing protein [Bacteroidota bacterium]